MYQVKIHAPKSLNFANPFLHLWYPGYNEAFQDYFTSEWDDYGPVFTLNLKRNYFCFKFGDKRGEERVWDPIERCYGQHLGVEVWTVSGINEVYPVKPVEVIGSTQELYLEIADLLRENSYLPDTDVSGQGVISMTGNLLFIHDQSQKNSFL